MVDPLYELFISNSQPLRSMSCAHHVCSTRFTSVWLGLFRLKYQMALPLGIDPSNVEYESPSTATFLFCAPATRHINNNIGNKNSFLMLSYD